MKIFELLKEGEIKLINCGFEKNIAKNDAEELLLYTLHISKSDYFKIKKKEIDELNKNLFFNAINDRIKHKPIQYITKNAVFFSYNFFVNENCLIPRIDSEVIVEQAFLYIKNNKSKFFNKKIKIFDVCCGSGCLGLSLTKMLIEKNIVNIDNIELSLLDKSVQAIQVAKINTQKLGLLAKYFISDILTNGLGFEKYDIILCNPPYIETNVISKLDDEVKKFEPKMALDGGEDGLMFYKSMSERIKNNLENNGAIFFEIGYNQGAIVENIFKDKCFNIKIVKDYGRQDRCIILTNHE